MTHETARCSDFKYRLTPHFVVLLRISLRMTKNGRDATELMREMIADAFRSWDESMPEEDYDIQLYDTLTRRFFDGFQQHVSQSTSVHDARVDENLFRNNQLFAGSSADVDKLPLTVASDEHANVLKAIAGLPEMFRSVMILSYVNGLSNKEIADLTGVHPYAIESLIDRGSGLLSEELLKLMVDNADYAMLADRAAKSA